MSTAKTKIDIDDVLQFLNKQWKEPILSLSPITGGENSQAFSFQTAIGNYIIRVNKERIGYDKDFYAFHNFKSIPIPKIFEVGNLDNNLYYAISEKTKGNTLDKISKEEQSTLIPKIIEILNSIHNTPIPKHQFRYSFFYQLA